MGTENEAKMENGVERKKPPVIPIVGYSGSGKTTVIEKLIHEFSRQGLKIGTIKHHGHSFEMDVPGKDTWRHKQAGAVTTILTSPDRIGIVRDVENEFRLGDLVPFMTHVDLIVVEGFKKAKRPKIEVFRSQISEEPACKNDENLIALVTDDPVSTDIPTFSPSDYKGITNFILGYFDLDAMEKP
jgi:molybdopterin-guanine dinucleotide biosynthesis protein B